MRCVADRLEPRRLLASITLVTHGFQSDGVFPQWVDQMALAVDSRIEEGASAWTNASLYKMVMIGSSPVTVQSFTRTNGPAPSASRTGEVVIELNWASISGLSGPSTATIATAVLNQLVASGPSLGFGSTLLSLPIQLIGHSRGGSLITDLARQLGQRGIWVDEVTPLDAYPIGSDPSAVIYDNVVFADQVYETHDFLVHGSAISGAHNIGFSSLPGGNSLDHSDTHLYYDATIARGITTDNDATINNAWWTDTTQRASIAYDWSRISGGTRPADGLGAIGGGSASRTHVASTTTTWPNVGSITASGGANGALNVGDTLSFNFRYQSVSNLSEVDFYLDNDSNPWNGFTRALTSAASLAPTGALPASTTASANYTWASFGLTPGEYFLNAIITDGSHVRFGAIAQPIFVTPSGMEMMNRRWSDDTANHNWSEPRNWSPGGIPTASDRAIVAFGTNNIAGTIAVRAIDAVGNAIVTSSATQHLTSLGLADSARFNLAGGGDKILVTQSLNLSSGATLDLADNDMIVDYGGASPATAIVQLVHNARNNGTWDAAGLTSSAAASNVNHITTLGVMQSLDYKNISALNTTFDGEAIDDTAILIKYTYYGDANFNGKVDGGDYSRLDFGFGQRLTGWINGDFNGDNKVDGADYGLIDFAFGTQGAAQRPSGTSAGSKYVLNR